MRLIKFRAWVAGAMVYACDLYGDVSDEYLISLSGEGFFMKESSNGNWCPSTIDAKAADVKLMQFTGLHDKNGKEIYEGDIVKYSYSRDTSGKDIAEFSEVVEWDRVLEYSGFMVHDFDREIIGNIYENPELLTTPTGGKK